VISKRHAGSAVAMERHHGNLATAYGGPVEREKQRALDEARRRYGADVRIIAVARRGNSSVIGVALVSQRDRNDY